MPSDIMALAIAKFEYRQTGFKVNQENAVITGVLNSDRRIQILKAWPVNGQVDLNRTIGHLLEDMKAMSSDYTLCATGARGYRFQGETIEGVAIIACLEGGDWHELDDEIIRQAGLLLV